MSPAAGRFHVAQLQQFRRLAARAKGAVLVVVGNLVADISLTIADPRIRLA